MLWKQESFGVLRPLQIEFFRNLLDKLNKNHLTRNLVHRLERLGYAVTLTLQQKAA